MPEESKEEKPENRPEDEPPERFLDLERRVKILEDFLYTGHSLPERK